MTDEITFEKCKALGKIKELEKSKNWVQKEIAVAENFLDTAKFNFDSERYEAVIVIGYLTIFHLNRALVYSVGKIVKTHICAVLAVKELFKDNKAVMDLLKGIENSLVSRNKIQYDGYDADKEMAEFLLDLGKDYLELVKKIVVK